jgi:hypothetical protein
MPWVGFEPTIPEFERTSNSYLKRLLEPENRNLIYFRFNITDSYVILELKLNNVEAELMIFLQDTQKFM